MPVKSYSKPHDEKICHSDELFWMLQCHAAPIPNPWDLTLHTTNSLRQKNSGLIKSWSIQYDIQASNDISKAKTNKYKQYTPVCHIKTLRISCLLYSSCWYPYIMLGNMNSLSPELYHFRGQRKKQTLHRVIRICIYIYIYLFNQSGKILRKMNKTWAVMDPQNHDLPSSDSLFLFQQVTNF